MMILRGLALMTVLGLVSAAAEEVSAEGPGSADGESATSGTDTDTEAGAEHGLDPAVVARAEAIADLLQAEEAAVAAELAARRPATKAHRDAFALAEMRALEAQTLLQVGDQPGASAAFLAAGNLLETIPSSVHHELEPALQAVRDRMASVAQGLLSGGTLEVLVEQPEPGADGSDEAAAAD